jgi:hypothetical protein
LDFAFLARPGLPDGECAAQPVTLADPNYQPGSQAARPGPLLNASVALIGTQDWNKLQLNRVVTEASVYGSQVSLWPDLVWGPAASRFWRAMYARRSADKFLRAGRL